MNYYDFMSLVKDSQFFVGCGFIIVIVDNHNVTRDFWDFFSRMTFLGFGSLPNGSTGERYSICFECTNCGDRFCYHH